MEKISKKEIQERIRLENPWWDGPASIDSYFKDMKPRAYLKLFYELLEKKDVNRAVVLMGPRRVGKTVMIYHAVQRLLEQGVDPKNICYISIDSPVYLGLGLDKLAAYYKEELNLASLKGCYVFFDEIQYLKGWEVHLKKLVDDYREAKFIASGSAAAALKMKSQESGAGRFTNFLLPPLTFYEYIDLLGLEDKLIGDADTEIEPGYRWSTTRNIKKLNKEFVKYLNIGGFPEALFSEEIQADPQRYIRSDIIDKVLMRDLPSLYGIQDIQELNRLFMVLAYNSGNEVSLGGLSQGSGVAKNTVKKYLEYLEAAFLITILHRVDQNAKRFKRANFFKVYLTNPSMRSALFGPVDTGHESMGNMVETAIVSQAAHSKGIGNIYYARWDKGEVDWVFLKSTGISSCIEIKWSNRYFEKPSELKGLIQFVQKHNPIHLPMVTTIDKRGKKVFQEIEILFHEASLYCYHIGKKIIGDLERHRRDI